MQHNTQVPVGKHNDRQHASPHHEVATDVKQMPIRPIIIIIIIIRWSLVSPEKFPQQMLCHDNIAPDVNIWAIFDAPTPCCGVNYCCRPCLILGFLHTCPRCQVQAWLESIYGGDPVPAYEVSQHTLDVLTQLKACHDTRERHAQLLLQDAEQKTEEYLLEGEQEGTYGGLA